MKRFFNKLAAAQTPAEARILSLAGRSRRALAVIILATVLSLSACAPTGDNQDSSQEKPLVGFTAPDFTLQTYDGREVSLSDFRGEKPVMLNFWAGWCPFCLAEMPAMALIQEEFGDEVAVIAVNRGQKLETAKKFTDDLNVTDAFTIVLDPDDRQFPKYQGIAMPMTFFIGRDGVIVDKHFGPLESKDMRERLKPLVE
ncbi:hypothetical protein COV82_03185 [Candidatus Peregrinibacteria bacterium CG11_big_fil_rev_8_21_14_0_20_46_8]|nr:MAG: hypothetical protein COV82_03185 [Candidatus Peregrinibacteria bacterium CG11_big_fil_rev_8_21_14_0_20_46_8]